MEPENKDTNNQPQPEQTPNNEPMEFDSSEMKIPQGEKPLAEANEGGSHTIFYLIISLLILGLVAAGGWYVWNTMPSSDPVVPAASDTNNEAEVEIQTEAELSESDDVQAIEEDLENTDFDELEAELNQAEAELDVMMQ